MENSEASQTNDSLGSYYASRRAPAVINYNGSDREIGRVFAEYKDKLVSRHLSIAALAHLQYLNLEPNH